MNWVRCSFFFMDLKVHPFGFLKRPYLLHSVQMAVTGDFLKKMSEISPPGSLFRIFHFLVVFLLFRHVPPCNKLVAWKWSLIWTMWSQNDRRWVYPAQWSILRGWAVKIPLIPDWPCTDKGVVCPRFTTMDLDSHTRESYDEHGCITDVFSCLTKVLR